MVVSLLHKARGIYGVEFLGGSKYREVTSKKVVVLGKER